jgi:origin recognition complex subunit 1
LVSEYFGRKFQIWKNMPAPRKSASKIKQARKWLAGETPGGALIREDSDDELGYDDLPWEWVYENDGEENVSTTPGSRKRKRHEGKSIVSAKMGKFQCKLGDTVLLKAADNEAWVGIICEFKNDEEVGMSAYFMWFSSPVEIRNKEKKRADSLPVSFSLSRSGIRLIGLE